MKKNAALLFSKRISFLILLFIIPFSAFCQPDYDFRNPVLISGTSLQVNAVYLFQNVKPGVDATVTITDINGGIYLSDIDGPSGYAEALQPILQVPAGSSGYVEFQVNFLVAGTNTPMIQTEVPATPIDVDGQNYGDGIVKEFDVLELSNGYVNYDMLGGELNMNISGGWVTGKNVAGVDYPGVDTTPRQVMFTAVNAGISQFTFRSGASSTSASLRQRLRSVYFKKFAYANSALSIPALISFNGAANDKKILLYWTLAAGSEIKQVVIEKAADPLSFSTLGKIMAAAKSSNAANYSFTDNGILPPTVYYRLKMTTINETVLYSNPLVFHSGAYEKQTFKMQPSVIIDHSTITLYASKKEQTLLQVVDLNGRSVYHKNISLQEGDNNITVNGFNALPHGTYVAIVNTSGILYAQKIMVQ